MREGKKCSRKSDKGRHVHAIAVRAMNGQAIAIYIIAALLIASFANEAYAAQIDAALIPEFDRAAGSFVGVKFVTITYETGSAMAALFNGRTERIEFSMNGTNATGMSELIVKANQALIRVQSPVNVTSANLTYTGVLRGGPDRLTLTYSVEFTPTYTGFKLDRNATDNILIDINWRGFVISEPVYVNAPERGEINVNQPIGLLQATFPEFADKLVSTEARTIMTEPILDFSEIGSMSMERWHVLFDPTFSQVSGNDIFKGDFGRAKVLSVYSLGECSIREGCPPPKEGDASVNIDGTAVRVHISTPQPNSHIEIAGFTSIETVAGHETIRVSLVDKSPELPLFTIQVLFVFAGMMAAIAIFVLFRSRK